MLERGRGHVRILSGCVWVDETLETRCVDGSTLFAVSLPSASGIPVIEVRCMMSWSSESDDIKFIRSMLMEAGLSTRWKNKPEIKCKSFRTDPVNAEIDISRLVRHGRSACMYIYHLQEASLLLHEGSFAEQGAV